MMNSREATLVPAWTRFTNCLSFSKINFSEISVANDTNFEEGYFSISNVHQTPSFSFSQEKYLLRESFRPTCIQSSAPFCYSKNPWSELSAYHTVEKWESVSKLAQNKRQGNQSTWTQRKTVKGNPTRTQKSRIVTNVATSPPVPSSSTKDEGEIYTGPAGDDLPEGNPEESVSDKDLATHQKADNLKNMILERWVIKNLRKNRVRVEGRVVKGEFAGEQWTTSSIFKRIDNFNVETKTGSVYTLQGPMDKMLAESEGFNHATIRAFSGGFPNNWFEVIQVDPNVKPKNNILMPSIECAGDNCPLGDSDVCELKAKSLRKRKHAMKAKAASPLPQKRKIVEDCPLDDSNIFNLKFKPRAKRTNKMPKIAEDCPLDDSNIFNLKLKPRAKRTNKMLKIAEALDDSNIFNLKLKPRAKRTYEMQVDAVSPSFQKRPKEQRKTKNDAKSKTTEKQPASGQSSKETQTNLQQPIKSGKPPSKSKTFDDVPDDSIQTLADELPKSSRGRKIIPRLEWWANERINISMPYIMQEEDCDITIVQATTSVKNKKSEQSSQKKLKPQEINRRESPFTHSHPRVETSTVLENVSGKPKPRCSKNTISHNKSKIAKNGTAKEGKSCTPSEHLKSKRATKKNLSFVNGNSSSAKESELFKKSRMLSKTLTTSRKSANLLTVDNTLVNKSIDLEENPKLLLGKRSRTKKPTGFYSEDNLAIKFEKAKPSRVKSNLSILKKGKAADGGHFANNSKLTERISDQSKNESQLGTEDKRKSFVDKTAKGKGQVKQTKRKRCKINSTEIDNALNDETIISKANKENNVIRARKGTLKYKRQVRKLIDNHNKDYEADMFESNNSSKNTNIFQSMLQAEDDSYNVGSYATPVINSTLLSMRPEEEAHTAVHSSTTPNCLKSLNRSDMDCYNHERKKWKQNPPAAQKMEQAQAVKEKLAKVPKVIQSLSTDLFDVIEVEEHDEEAEGPKDYYFDEH